MKDTETNPESAVASALSPADGEKARALLRTMNEILLACEARKAAATSSSDWGPDTSSMTMLLPSRDSFTIGYHDAGYMAHGCIDCSFKDGDNSEDVARLSPIDQYMSLPTLRAFLYSCIRKRIKKMERSFFMLDSAQFDTRQQAATICAWRMLLADCMLILDRAELEHAKGAATIDLATLLG